MGLIFFAFFEKFFVPILTSGGYVGLSIATLLSQHHQVTAVDIIPEKVDMIKNRKSPIQDEHCVKRSEKLDNKIYILLTVCAFIFVLLTSIIEKASTFQMSQDMTKISLIIIYWLLLLVDVVIFCVLLEKLVVLLGSIEFQRLDINNIMELNIIEKNPRTAVKYIGANYMQCVENNHTILEKRYEVFNTCVRFLVLNVLLSLSLSFVCVFIFMK